MKYWAFISYSSKDRAWGDWLIKAIETYKVPKGLVGKATTRGEPVPARLYPVFRDRDELPTETDLGTMIAQALEQSRYLIVICSPNAAQSKWVNEEILTFKRLGRADRIFSLIIDGSPNATDTPGKDPKLECYPNALRFALGGDGQLTTERTHPISADAREHGDGRDNSLLKLLAGVLGVNYDDLRQRDAARRRHRLRLLAGFSTILTLVFAGLALIAWLQRNEAIVQREYAHQQELRAIAGEGAALKERDRAITARKQAESILNFLLFDLRDQLQPLGRLDIIEKVQARVDDYYHELSVDPKDAEQLRLRTAALLNQGERLQAEGKLSAALAVFQESLQLRRDLVQRSPLHAGWQRDLAQNLNKIGELRRAQGDLPAALAAFQESLQIGRELIKRETGRSAAQDDLTVTLDLVGDVLRAQGNLPAALDPLEESLQIRRTLAQRAPLNSGWQSNLAASLNLIGGVRRDQEQLPFALEAFEEALGIRRTLAQREPANATWQGDLATSLSLIGGIHRAQGEIPLALTNFEEALEIRRALALQDPLNSVWQGDLATSLGQVGEARWNSGNPKAAIPLLEQCVEIRRMLVQRDALNSGWQADLAASVSRLVDVRRAQKNPQGVLQLLDESIRIRRGLVKQNPGDTFQQIQLANDLVRTALARGQQDRNQAVLSVAALVEALPILQRLEKAGALPPDLKTWPATVANSISEIRTQWKLPR